MFKKDEQYQFNSAGYFGTIYTCVLANEKYAVLEYRDIHEKIAVTTTLQDRYKLYTWLRKSHVIYQAYEDGEPAGVLIFSNIKAARSWAKSGKSRSFKKFIEVID